MEGPHSSSLVGQVLGGRFEVLALMGQGGMGAVYRARDRELDEVVALKVIRPELARLTEMVRRFRQEVKLARRVTHRNVARIFELGTLDGTAFFTMELVEGRPLTARMRAEGRLPWREAVAIAAGVLDGLDAAHAVGVVHRDVKPDNLLIEAPGGRIVITDFGIASVRAAEPGLITGTPTYMAPEQAAGEPPTPAVDVYAVGVVLFEMLTGAPAFTGTPDQILADKRARDHLEIAGPGIERALADVVARATATDPARRIRTAHELRALLAPWVEGGPPAPRMTSRRRSDTEIQDVVVITTVDRTNPARYLADAVYQQVVSHLWQTPRLRVIPGWQPGGRARAAATVTIDLGDVIAVRAQDAAGIELVLARLPRSAGLVEGGGRAVAQTIVAALGHVEDDGAAAVRSPAVTDLVLRARELAGRLSQVAIAEAVQLYDQAVALAPHDAVVAAGRAMVMARQLASIGAEGSALATCTRAADAALARSPELAEAQIAAGHVTLHRGEPIAAAQHMRRAIAAAPHLAEAHEWLGRMLLEAAYLDEGMARLETALALDPRLELARWEIARAYALEDRWDEYERIARELIGVARMRVTPWSARFALWRGDTETTRAMVEASNRREIPDGAGRGFMGALAGVIRDGWEPHRAALRALALHGASASARRRSLLCQLVAEAAGSAGDVATVADVVAVAIDHGFYDLHWLDRCPVLAGARAAGVLARFRPRVAARAEAILDALYGDRPSSHGTADTAVATPEGLGLWDATIDEGR